MSRDRAVSDSPRVFLRLVGSPNVLGSVRPSRHTDLFSYLLEDSPVGVGDGIAAVVEEKGRVSAGAVSRCKTCGAMSCLNAWFAIWAVVSCFRPSGCRACPRRITASWIVPWVVEVLVVGLALFSPFQWYRHFISTCGAPTEGIVERGGRNGIYSTAVPAPQVKRPSLCSFLHS